MINQEGCVNTLSMECMDFYYRYSVLVMTKFYLYNFDFGGYYLRFKFTYWDGKSSFLKPVYLSDDGGN